jgi:ribosomal protein L16/L10AE
MHRRGSVSFVVEVLRRRFPQNGATTSDLDHKSGSRTSPMGTGRLSVTPLIERERVSDPTIEAAKIAAKRFFSKPGTS